MFFFIYKTIIIPPLISYYIYVNLYKNRVLLKFNIISEIMNKQNGIKRSYCIISIKIVYNKHICINLNKAF
jgi:hypothetical protein